MKITSQPLTLVDTTDSRKLEVYISSNHPNTQLYNVNNTTNKYTPDWSTTNLKLNADIFLDSKKITPEKKKWYRQTVNGSEEDLFPNTDYTEEVIVSANMTSAIVTYMCKVEYQGLTAFSKITFTKTDTGLNGTNGAPAPAVQAQYSVDGQTNWTATLNAATHKYIRYSYDGGKTWTTAIKMVGEDGTSVNIKGTATSKAEVSGTSYYTLVYNGSTITGASLGDAYLLGGDMYVCVDSKDGSDHFMYVGHIQGPQGNDGQSSYVFIRYAPANPTDSNMSSTPSSTTTHIGICTVNTNNAPKTASSYTWSKFVGDNAKSIILSGTSQIFKVAQGTSPTYTPATITVSAQVINTTVATWEYSVNGGIDWTTVAPDGVSSNTSTNTLTITGKDLVSNTLVIRASNGDYKDIYTVYKVFDGVNGTPGNPGQPASMAFLTNENISFSANSSGQVALTSFTTNVVAYKGTDKVTPTIRTNADGTLAITGLPSGMTVASPVISSNEQILTFTIAKDSNLGSASSNNGTITIPITSPVSTNLILSWSKINTGATGAGIESTTVSYGVSDSSSSQPTDWQPTIPTVAEGKYLWTRTIIDYTDEKIPDTVTYIYAKQGTKGDSGTAGSSVTVSSVQYQEGASATTAPTGKWSDVVVAVADGKYLWTKTVFSDGKTAYGVAKQGANGKDGVGISSITVDYGVSDNASTKPTNWQQSIPVVAEGKYLWTRTITDYTDTSVADTVAYVYAKQGIKGETGAAGSSVTVSSIQYQAGTSATTAPTSTWSDSVVTVSEDNYLWTKTTFSDGKVAYGVAKQGQKGDKGDQGVAGADAYTVLLTNESHVFAGSTSTAIASSATTQVLAYKGAASQSVTIVSVNGVTASTASTATGIAGLSFQCNALSGTSPTITFTCTTAFVSPNGTIPIVIKVGGISITKMFTYSIAFKGAAGGTGAASSSYWLISNADTVQKTSNGDILCTPATLTFTGKSKTGSGTPADYAARWIIAYSTDGIAYTNAYTSTANEASASLAASPSYKAVRARMYLAGGTTTLLDEQIIPFVSDGAVGASGVDAVTFQIYSSNGYALSTNTPTVTLQTFAYIGDVAITAGATYQWYAYSNTGWAAVTGATNQYLVVSRDDVVFSKSYMCKMTFNGVEYTSVATIDDKNDDNKVFTSKPSNYVAGDIWIVSIDYVPNGVEVGTLLRAEHTNTSYADNDWITAMKYDEKLNQLQESLEKYNQYFSFDSTDGLKIGSKDANGTPSKFSTSLTNERLSFNYGNESIAYINGTKMNIKEAEIESPLTITGKYSGSTMLQAPVINIGNFSIIVESNGSLSIVANI